MAGSDRFVRLPTELLEALLRTPLNGTQWHVLFWILRNTLGWNRNLTAFSWYQIARDLLLDRGGVVRCGNRLLKSGILFLQNGQVGIQQDATRWQRTELAPPGKKAMTNVSADRRHRKAMTENITSDDDCHRKRCRESSLFRRAKDSSKDRLKTHKDKHSPKSDDDRHRSITTGNSQRRHLAGAARPIAGKYDGLSQN